MQKTLIIAAILAALSLLLISCTIPEQPQAQQQPPALPEQEAEAQQGSVLPPTLPSADEPTNPAGQAARTLQQAANKQTTRNPNQRVQQSTNEAPECASLNNKVQQAFGSVCGQTKYHRSADVNDDNTVNMNDLTLTASKKTDAAWCASKLNQASKSCTSPECQQLINLINSQFGKSCFDNGYDARADINLDIYRYRLLNE